MPAYRPSNRYNSKNYFTSKPKANRGKQYRKYYHQQPSKVVYVEEPDSEIESESESEVTDYSEEVEDSDIESEVYEFDLNENEQPELEYYGSSDYDTDDYNDIIDLNDELENAAVDRLDSRGKVYDLNDELVRYYDDSDSDSDSGSDSELDSELEAELELYEPEDILDIIDLNDQLQAEALKQITGCEYDEANSSSDISSSESNSDDDSDIDSDDSDSETDLDIEYSSDEEDLNDQLQLENVRQVFADDLVSDDEVSVPPESDLESETEYIEVESDMDSGSEDEQEYDICDECNAFDDESDSSDDEGITIYRHRFDLPDSYGSDYEDESDYSDDEIPEQLMLRANDSDDEIAMIDLSEDLQNSKDCELVDLNDHTYKLNLRFPSIVKDELKIDFIKNKNELVISGRFNFDADSDDEEIEEEIEEQAQEIEDEQGENKEVDNAEILSSSSSSSDSSSSTSSSSSSSSDSDSDSESSSSSESDDSDSDSESELSSSDSEEVQEDTESLIQDFANHEIRFEKHFQFDKVIKFNEIKAKFLKNGELELIIPNENQENILSIDVESDDESVTDEIIKDQNQIEGSNANVEVGAEKDEQYEDASMEQ